MSLTAEQRYRQAMRKAVLISDRNRRLFLAGKIPVLPCLDEKSALIAEIDRAYRAGLADATRPKATAP